VIDDGGSGDRPTGSRRNIMKLWAIAGLGGALVCCGGESVIGGGVETGGTEGFTGGTSGDFTEGAGGTTGGAGGTTGAAPSVGGTTGESSGSGGTAAIGAGGGFPLSNFRDPCDIEATIGRSCALSGCHKKGAIAPASGLDLTPDSWLVPRIRDVPARHGDIYCGQELCDPIPDECSVGVVQLADTTDWQASWIYRKLTDPAGCGESMPISISSFTEDDRACFVAFLKDIADFW
jgi:hypothetical protein